MEISQSVLEKIFDMVFTIYGHGGHLGHVTQMREQTLVPPTHRGSAEKLALIGQAVLEIFQSGGRRPRTDGRRHPTDTGAWV